MDWALVRGEEPDGEPEADEEVPEGVLEVSAALALAEPELRRWSTWALAFIRSRLRVLGDLDLKMSKSGSGLSLSSRAMASSILCSAAVWRVLISSPRASRPSGFILSRTLEETSRLIIPASLMAAFGMM